MSTLKTALRKVADGADGDVRLGRVEMARVAEDALAEKCKHDWEGLPKLATPSLYHNVVFADWCKRCGAVRLTRESKNNKMYQTIKLPEREK
jgi:hypothetical protein